MDSTGSRFQVGFDKSSQRGNAIKARIAEFQEVGLAEAAAMLSVLKAELPAHEKLLKSTHRSLSVKRQNVEQLETSLESLKGRLQDNERLIRTPSSPNPQMLDEYKSLSLEYKMLMPPRLPPTTYKRDPVTGQASRCSTSIPMRDPNVQGRNGKVPRTTEPAFQSNVGSDTQNEQWKRVAKRDICAP